MKKNLTGIGALAAISLSLFSCGGGKNNTPASATGSLSTPQADVAASSAGDGYSVMNLDQILCKNPIQLEEPGLTPLTRRSEFPKGKFKLSKMQTFMVQEATNESFIASASSSDQFAVKVECNGTQDPSADNYERTYTDSDGGTHNETHTHTLRLSGSFRASEGIDTLNHSNSANQRSLEVKFENGKVISAETQLMSASSSSSDEFPEAQVPLEKIQVAQDTYFTMRFYALSPKKLEIRVLIEFPSDPNGKRAVQYSKAIYERN